jgi:hypothetical protein
MLEWDGYDEWDYLFNEDDVDIEAYAAPDARQEDNRTGFVRGSHMPYLQPDDEVEEPAFQAKFQKRHDNLIEHYFASRALGRLN